MVTQNDTSPREERFLALYDTYRADLFTFLLIRVRDREEAEDLLQILFMRLWCNLGDGQEKSKLYLFMIARNLVIDYFRKQRHRMHLSLETESEKGTELMHDPLDPAELAEDKVLREERARELHASIAAILTPEEQQSIGLSMQGYRPHEVSASLGVTLGALKTRKYRAKQKLQAHAELLHSA